MSLYKNENGTLEKIASKEFVSDNKKLLDFFYPVGTYYETSDANFNPNETWGGTWVQDTKGQVMVSKSDSGTFATLNGNAGSETKSIAVANLPSHNHTFTGSKHTHSFSATSGSTTPTAKTSVRVQAGTTDTSDQWNIMGRFMSTYPDENIKFTEVTWSGNHAVIPGHPKGNITNPKFNRIEISLPHTHSLSGTTGETTQGGTIGSTGSGTALSVVQNSKVCIRWHRTA